MPVPKMPVSGWLRRKTKKRQGVAIFPGQGSQKLGMARVLKPETQNRIFEVMENVLKRAPHFTSRLIDLITLDTKSLPEKEKIAFQAELNDTAFAQMAIFYISCGCWDEMLETAETIPSDVFGLSLGEYGALYAARVIDLETGTILVYNRAQLMSLASVSLNGGMLGVKKSEGIKEKDVRKAIKTTKSDVIIANYNSYRQIALSGRKDYLVDISLLLRGKGYATSMVPVSGAFHHPKYMSVVEDGLKLIFANLGIKLRKPKLRVHFNYNGEIEDDPKRMQNNLIHGVTSPVQLRKIIDSLKKKTIRESVMVVNGDRTIHKILDDFPELVNHGSA